MLKCVSAGHISLLTHFLCIDKCLLNISLFPENLKIKKKISQIYTVKLVKSSQMSNPSHVPEGWKFNCLYR